ncbi:UDP-glucose dehydrogenase family protein [Tuwongella immobilis]|uniref:UDP-glucose 6-dehydrogenase n=1 Tax=Tuwongella immobilis TaxID=692036 RepID=A0A6C2YMY3_9BACT|nr:UDP-glucose/GDP-mannose dehydrogenase family protein [Tuwongella immobilis]VIP02483.1 udp-glucose 6-dehydrogenase : Nucleotide sugar dehydrogenase OS=Isosphaera pallida (strain ATCC 43644 / DSM 9630 / IS1B) GN=Isop_0060 PE=3 SV=1: UDPG_MGDP_dh_N: UDPG_MGDP_dh: UDPG_MGDP_dh_C [Tuwongella immobilis]VTS01535.1 udp-glucose 6-dehydrogenase : Nucleotide sugar dehydrogenase OS=Isosphaera pallida (strain ATCC 43644 / DSM 9630 / IS1B) GN=Isop_0060 PE=3 SV=1: UDPG_MGDP_dh_N: UDPG_MGDP_dh: UDPG_MGDP_dh_C
MRITVIGTGYVGLVTATCLAESGNHVFGIDKDEAKIQILLNNGLPIYEPGLLEMVQKNRREERLKFGTDLEAAIRQTKLVFLAVGTPQSDTGDADLRGIWAVGEAVGRILNKLQAEGDTSKRILIIKSTVPVGTNRELTERMKAMGCTLFEVASNPEFLKEGAAIDDFMKPDRVVVGVRSHETAEILRELYAPFLRTERPFLVMTPESAEMTKYAANAMLATKISFINEMANLCDRLGADINDVRRGMGHDVRIGFQFLFPGAGYGGSCFPKDVRAVMAMGRKMELPLPMVEAVDQVNEAQKQVLPTKIRQHFGDSLAGKFIAIWGLAFKPRTDDIREAPSLVLIESLLAAGCKLRVHDPEALNNVKQIYGDQLIYCDRPYGALEGADALVIVTEWQEFRNPDFEVMRRLMRNSVIFDGRNLYEPRQMESLGFTYYGIGRGRSKPESAN